MWRPSAKTMSAFISTLSTCISRRRTLRRRSEFLRPRLALFPRQRKPSRLSEYRQHRFCAHLQGAGERAIHRSVSFEAFSSATCTPAIAAKRRSGVACSRMEKMWRGAPWSSLNRRWRALVARFRRQVPDDRQGVRRISCRRLGASIEAVLDAGAQRIESVSGPRNVRCWRSMTAAAGATAHPRDRRILRKPIFALDRNVAT